MSLFPTAFLLGVAGLGPTGAIVIISALALGVSKKEIVIFALTTFVGTVLVGFAFSRFVGNSVEYLSDMLNYIPDHIYMVLELVVSFVLLKWVLESVFFKEKKNTKIEKKESFFVKYIKNGLFVVGVIFAIAALTDPSFLALLTLCGQDSNVFAVILANTTWVLISQAPIFILTIAVVFDKHEEVIRYFNEKIKNNHYTKKLKKLLIECLFVLMLFVGLWALIESLCFLFTGTWIFY